MSSSGATGAFIVETKAYTGRFYAQKGQLMVNGVDQTKRVRQATGEAMEIKRRLKNSNIDTWVEAVIALPSTKLRKGSMRFANVHVLEAAALHEYLLAAACWPHPHEICSRDSCHSPRR